MAKTIIFCFYGFALRLTIRLLSLPPLQHSIFISKILIKIMYGEECLWTSLLLLLFPLCALTTVYVNSQSIYQRVKAWICRFLCLPRQLNNHNQASWCSFAAAAKENSSFLWKKATSCNHNFALPCSCTRNHSQIIFWSVIFASFHSLFSKNWCIADEIIFKIEFPGCQKQPKNLSSVSKLKGG